MYCTRYSCPILMKLFSGQFFEKYSYQISLKSVQWESSCSMRTDGRTDMKLMVAFRNFANAPKNEFLHNK